MTAERTRVVSLDDTTPLPRPLPTQVVPALERLPRSHGPMSQPGKPHTYWTVDDDRASLQEGWLLTNDSSNRTYIAKLDDPASIDDLGFADPKFDCDSEAEFFVLQLAMAGSRRHMLAIYLQGFAVEEELDFHPPRELLP